MSLSSILSNVGTKPAAIAKTYVTPNIHQMSFTAGDIDNRGTGDKDANNNYISWLGGNVAGIQGDGDDNTSTHRNLIVDTSADAYDEYTETQVALRNNYLINASFSYNAYQFQLGSGHQEIWYRIMCKQETGYITPALQHKNHKYYSTLGGNDANTFTGRINRAQTNQGGSLSLTPYIYPITQYGPSQVERAFPQYTSSETANRFNDDHHNTAGVSGEDAVVGIPVGEWYEFIFHHFLDPSIGTGAMQEIFLNGQLYQKVLNFSNCGGTNYPTTIEWMHEKDYSASQITDGDDISSKMWIKKFDVSSKPIEPLITKGWDWL